MNNSSLLGTNFCTQIGLLVHDVDKVSQSYARFLGVEPPVTFWTDGQDKTEAEHNGKPTNARAKLAFFDLGSLQLELIQPDHEPSTWREYLDAHGEGVHHIAFEVQGMKEKIMLMERNGMPLMQKGEYEGGRYAYMDSYEPLKVILELLENDK
ncbi:VOC family protein [Paenibacillus endoradicis]|uniref:VOC family protein n=1 Tax=Paenibacillus endoradicis TaxID=2972487 RepID=UPI00215910BE|nr:VOC family protein [Paenibacillus endoradicis]MCR8657909.1 VOC family protein [Paenibacillus endoradicis]